MGIIPEPRWKHPITRESKKKINLIKGVINTSPKNTFSPDECQVLIPFVDDELWLSRINPVAPKQKINNGWMVSASGATLIINTDQGDIVVDPGPDFCRKDIEPKLIAITHAHHDHIGGLLVATTFFQDADIVCSSGTYDLLKLLPDAQAYIDLIGSRGHVLETNGDPKRISNIDICLYPAGHLYGASMIDICTTVGRCLITGDYSLREIGGLIGAGWPFAEYDVLIMESSHAWDIDTPTADEDENWRSLYDACQSAFEDGYTRIVIPATALGEAQDIYYGLSRAQMRGYFPAFTLRMFGKAAEVSQLYKRANKIRMDTWVNSIASLNSLEYIPDYSIVIGSTLEQLEDEIPPGASSVAYVVPTVGGIKRSTGYVFAHSSHASFRELFATAVSISCHQVALYHGQHSDPEHRSPLTRLLHAVGRKTLHLTDRPQRVGG